MSNKSWLFFVDAGWMVNLNTASHIRFDDSTLTIFSSDYPDGKIVLVGHDAQRVKSELMRIGILIHGLKKIIEDPRSVGRRPQSISADRIQSRKSQEIS